MPLITFIYRDRKSVKISGLKYLFITTENDFDFFIQYQLVAIDKNDVSYVIFESEDLKALDNLRKRIRFLYPIVRKFHIP